LLAVAATGGWRTYTELRAIPATVTPVVRGKAIEAIYATGSVEAEERVFVKAKAIGSVEELLVREGATVRRGDLLARIDNPAAGFDLKRGQADRGAASAMASADSPQIAALRAQAQAIRAELAIARQELEHVERLVRSNAVPRVELERAQSRVAQLDGTIAANEAQQRALQMDLSANVARQDVQVKALASRVADTEVRSPMDGVVLSRMVSIGEVVTVNQTLFKIGDTKSLVLEVSVDEADVARVSYGEPDGRDPHDQAPSEVAVSFYAFPKQVFHGRVFEVMPDANRDRKAYVTKVRLTDAPPRMRSGMSAEVNIIASQEDGVLLVPTAAEAEGKVWVVEDGRARRKSVTTGIRDLLRVQIPSGLAEGDLVIVDGHASLREGARVSVTVRDPDKYLTTPDARPPIQTAIK
jgi:multidrug efflux pump subunit AcrA (membrane-fusion protein)